MNSAPYHTQSNAQVEAVSKTIKDYLKKKLKNLKGAYVDELTMGLPHHSANDNKRNPLFPGIWGRSGHPYRDRVVFLLNR